MSNLHERPAASTNLYPSQDVRYEIEKQGDTDTAFGDKSPGVRQIEAIATNLTKSQRYILWIAVFLTAYSYTLDLTTRYAYQNFALSDFGAAAQVSTVAVVRSIVAAAAQPLYAKISDYFGRLSILFIAVLFYVVGTIVQAASQNLDQFLGGAVLYQFGYTGTQRECQAPFALRSPAYRQSWSRSSSPTPPPFETDYSSPSSPLHPTSSTPGSPVTSRVPSWARSAKVLSDGDGVSACSPSYSLS